MPTSCAQPLLPTGACTCTVGPAGACGAEGAVVCAAPGVEAAAVSAAAAGGALGAPSLELPGPAAVTASCSIFGRVASLARVAESAGSGARVSVSGAERSCPEAPAEGLPGV